jgi:hypothetical protein
MSRRRTIIGLIPLVLAISITPFLLHHTRIKEFVAAKTSHLFHAFDTTTIETFYYTGPQFNPTECTGGDFTCLSSGNVSGIYTFNVPPGSDITLDQSDIVSFSLTANGYTTDTSNYLVNDAYVHIVSGYIVAWDLITSRILSGSSLNINSQYAAFGSPTGVDKTWRALSQ